MSGQQSRKFTTTPSFLQRDVSPAPTVRADQAQAVAATVQGRGGVLNQMAGALPGFFGTAAKPAAQISEIENHEDLVEIERQNGARADQGLADQSMGKERDTDLSRFQAYKGAYDMAMADSTANTMTQDLAVHLRDLRTTGAWTPSRRPPSTRRTRSAQARVTPQSTAAWSGLRIRRPT